MFQATEKMLVDILKSNQPIKAIRLCKMVYSNYSVLNLKHINYLLSEMQARKIVERNEFHEWCLKANNDENISVNILKLDQKIAKIKKSDNKGANNISSLDYEAEVEGLLKEKRKILHYKEINEEIFNAFGVNRNASIYAKNSNKCLNVITGFYVHSDIVDNNFYSELESQKRNILKFVIKELKKSKVMDCISLSTTLNYLGYGGLFTKNGLRYYLCYSPNLNGEINIEYRQSTKCHYLTFNDEKNETGDTQEGIGDLTSSIKIRPEKKVDTNENADSKKDVELEKDTKEVVDYESRLDIPLSSLGLSFRTFRCLSNWFNVMKLRDLVSYTEDELLDDKDIDSQSLGEIKSCLERFDLHLGMDTGKLEFEAFETDYKQEALEEQCCDLNISIEPHNDMSYDPFIERKIYESTAEKVDQKEKIKFAEKPLTSLKISSQLAHFLNEYIGIITIRDLLRFSEEGMKQVDGFDESFLVEIKCALEEHGLRLAKTNNKLPIIQPLTLYNYDEIDQSESLKVTDKPLASFRLSVRLSNCLIKNEGLETIGDVLKYTEEELLNLKNFGKTSLSELKRILKEYGLRLARNKYELTALESMRHEGVEYNMKKYTGEKEINKLFDYFPWMVPFVMKLYDKYTAHEKSTVYDALEIKITSLNDVNIADFFDEVGFRTFGDIYDEFINSLNFRQRTITLKRVHVDQKVSLEKLGQEFKITRERVRQLEKKAIQEANHRFSQTDVKIQAHILREKMATIIHYETATILSRPFVSKCKCSKNARMALFDEAGPYIFRDNWLILAEEKDRVKGIESSLKYKADKIGRIDKRVIDEITEGVFCRKKERDRFLTEILGLHKVFGEWMLRDSQRTRVFLALYKIGSPATKEEIAEYADIDDPSRVSGYLTCNDVFCRYDKTRWAFTDWTDDPYSGITKEIEQRIDEEGGMTTVERLVTELPEKFGVAESSVRANLAVPKFVIEEGYVRYATIGEIRSTYHGEVEKVSNSVELDDGSWAARILIEKRYLKGYSAEIHAAIAAECGLFPGDSIIVPIEGTRYSASLIWRITNPKQTVDLGRIEPILRELDLQPGEEMVVAPSKQTIKIYRLEDAPIKADNDREYTISKPHPVDDLLRALFDK